MMLIKLIPWVIRTNREITSGFIGVLDETISVVAKIP